MNVIEFIEDPQLLGKAFKPKWLGFGSDTWSVWKIVLRVIFALPLNEMQRAVACRHTGRTVFPDSPVNEAWLCCGRRAGKTRMSAAVAVYLATSCNYEQWLAPGETGTVVLVAPDRTQAKTILRYIAGLLRGSPLLAAMVVRETVDTIELANRIVIAVYTASHKTIRGTTTVAAIVDEAAFLPTNESATPDAELLTALRPSMLTIPNALLLIISTPYSQAGEMFRAAKDFFGNDNSMAIFWNADSITMNPSLPRKTIDAAFRADPVAAMSEYGQGGFVQFRSDVEALFSQESIHAVTVKGRFELPPSGHDYFGFVDVSGGRVDSSTAAVAHMENGRGVLDCLREIQAPHSPQEAIREISEMFRS
jgi:terminase large subunit-like protein